MHLFLSSLVCASILWFKELVYAYAALIEDRLSKASPFEMQAVFSRDLELVRFSILDMSLGHHVQRANTMQIIQLPLYNTNITVAILQISLKVYLDNNPQSPPSPTCEPRATRWGDLSIAEAHVYSR